MPRSGRLRNYIKEVSSSSRAEKLSFIPPFLIIIVESVLLIHALSINVPDIMVVELTTVLLIISIIEIILVSREIHSHYQRSNFDKILTIRLDDFIIEKKKKNVKKIVEEFIEKYSKYSNYRSEIYHTACQILETHKEEQLEKKIEDKLLKFIKKNKDKTVDEIISAFINKYPPFKKNSSEIYQKTCQIMVDLKE